MKLFLLETDKGRRVHYVGARTENGGHVTLCGMKKRGDIVLEQSWSRCKKCVKCLEKAERSLLLKKGK